MNIGKCNSCGRPIRWIITPKGKRMPLDPDASDSIGNVVIDHIDDKGNEHGHVLKGDEDSTLPRLVPHFATCPKRKR